MSSVIEINGDVIEMNDAGFMVNRDIWNEQVAEKLAALVEIKLTNAHWEIILFIRNYYQQFNHLPNARVFTKAIRKEFGEHKGNSRYLYGLFPDGPLKFACMIGGLPKPTSCI